MVVKLAVDAVKLKLTLFGNPMVIQIRMRKVARPPNSRCFRALMVDYFLVYSVFILNLVLAKVYIIILIL